MNRPRLSVLGVFILLLACSMAARADVFTLIRKFTMDRLELEVQVADESGQPLVGAVLWYVGRPVRKEIGLALSSADLARMAQRYAKQGDFLDVGDIPATVFERSDVKGSYRDFREIGGIPDKRYTYAFVATKRGFLPQVLEGVAPLNERHVVSFRLQRDPNARTEPRMETFDRLMAEARSPIPGEDLVSEARMRKLEELNRQVRALAQSLEADGLSDDASAVYWALADFPDVIRAASADGGTRIVGYRNGRNDEQSQAERAHAAELNTRIPKLLIDKRLAALGYQEKGIHDGKKGVAYLKVFEELAFNPAYEPVLPWELGSAVLQFAKWGTPEQACDLLQKAYRFEPSAMSLRDWWYRQSRIEERRQELKLPASACVVEGLPEWKGK